MTTSNLSIALTANFNLDSQLNKVADYLKNFALKLTRDTSQAEDLFQDTVYLVIKNQSKYQLGTNFKAWVSTIMRNTFINSYRKRKRYLTVIDDVPMAQTSTMNNKGETNMYMEEINAAIHDLGELYETPLRMVGEGYQYDEISEILNLPLSTVKSRIFFARKKMRQLYPNYAVPA